VEEIFAEQNLAVILFCWNLFLQIVEKMAKIRTRKNLVPHSMYGTKG